MQIFTVNAKWFYLASLFNST